MRNRALSRRPPSGHWTWPFWSSKRESAWHRWHWNWPSERPSVPPRASSRTAPGARSGGSSTTGTSAATNSIKSILQLYPLHQIQHNHATDSIPSFGFYCSPPSLSSPPSPLSCSTRRIITHPKILYTSAILIFSHYLKLYVPRSCHTSVQTIKGVVS